MATDSRYMEKAQVVSAKKWELSPGGGGLVVRRRGWVCVMIDRAERRRAGWWSGGVVGVSGRVD